MKMKKIILMLESEKWKKIKLMKVILWQKNEKNKSNVGVRKMK